MADQNRLVAEPVYHPIGGMNIDSNGIALNPNECVDSVNCLILQSEVRARAGSAKLEAAADPLEDILKYHRYVDPLEGSVTFAFCANSIWKYVSKAVGWVDVSDNLVAGKNFTQWSVVSCISDEVGATVVAAGSVYTRPNDAQSSGGDRLLLYFDRTVLSYGEFKLLPISNLLPIVDENTGVVGPTPSGTVVGPALQAKTLGQPNYDPDYLFYEPGTAVLKTIQSGIIAVAGETEYGGAGVEYYRWIPTNTANILYGDTSFLMKDGSSWELDILTNAYNGELIFIDYEYGASTDYHPTYLSFYHNSLILANTYEEATYQPWRVRWTEPGDIYKTKANSYLDVAVGDITPILEMRVVETTASSVIESYLYIYKQNAFVRASYNRAYNQDPNLPVPLLELNEAYSEGIETVRTLQVINGTQIYLGRNDIYAFNGYERQSLTLNVSTGASRIREYIFNNLDIDNLNLCHSVYDEVGKRYILFVKFLSDSTDYPTNAFVLDMERGSWTRFVFPECSAALAVDLTPNASIDSLVGNIENLEGNIEDLAGNSTKLVLLAMTKQSFIQGIGSTDKSTAAAYKVFMERSLLPDSGPSDVYWNGQKNGKDYYESLSTSDDRIEWSSIEMRWEAYLDNSLVGFNYSDTDQPPADVLPVITWSTNEPESSCQVTAYAGEEIESYFITRDFVGGTLENMDRTQMVYVEGRRGSIELSCDPYYSLDPTQFELIREVAMPSRYDRGTFSPDKTANNLRFLVRLKDGAIFRWMQVFSMKQDLTNI